LDGGGDRGLKNILVPIISNVRTVLEFTQDGIWLDGKVDLEADVVCDLVSLLWGVVDATGEGDNGNKVHERRPILLVVDQTSLTLFVRHGCLFHLCNRRMRGLMTLFSLDDAAVRGLQKAAISPKYFTLRIPREGHETRGSVNNRGVEAPDVNDNE
jgi:hypothetical protein